MSDRIINKFDKKYRFRSVFNQDTGSYARSDVLDENGKSTGVDPFMASFPELLDIGVMGHCTTGLDGKCGASHIGCYQSGATTVEEHMSLSLFKRIIRQCKGKVFQVALGGRGNPNEHPDFEEMLKFCRKNDVVPNYTTSGLGLTDEQVELTKKYCGAVAVSEHFQDYTREAIRKFINAGVTTNIHYVLNNASINKALWKLINTDFDNDVNAVIFLLHKPVGQGTDEQVLKIDDPIVPAFFEAVDEHEGSFKVGFDSCSIPGIVNFNKNIDPKSIDTCEGARFSAYITPDGIMTPCSFDQDKEYGNDLNVMSVKEVWDSELFNMFRFSLASSCLDCHDRKLCMGGCPLEREIVLCGREEKKYFKEF